MKTVGQTAAVTWLGLRSIPARLGTSMVVVIGVAMVVTVFIAALALATGFEAAMVRAGRPDRIVIVRGGADSEAASELSRDVVERLRDIAGIRKTAHGDPVFSAEALAFIPMVDRTTGLDSFVTLRGLGAQGLALRPEIRLIAGRMFHPGAREIVVGQAVQSRMGAAALGTTIALPEGDWPVVGVYTSGGDARESEILTDAETLISTYHRKGFNSVNLALESAGGFGALRDDLAMRPDLGVEALREDEYIARRSNVVNTLLRVVAFGVGAIMAAGAAFGAVNTMFSAIRARSSEIGTLRALGFAPGVVVTSVLIESWVLALAGALFGIALAWLILNGAVVSTLTGDGPSQVTFELRLSPQVVGYGVLAALLVGSLGGVMPAVRAGTQSIVEALRKT